MRLRTLPLALSCIITGSAAAAMAHCFKWPILLLALLTTLLLQILSNLANDLGDGEKGTDNEHRIGPKRAVQSGVISIGQMRRAVIICAGLALISGISLILLSVPDFDLIKEWRYLLSFLALGIAAIAAAIRYTVGKSAYGYRGLGDLFVFIFFGIIGVAGCFYLYAHYLDFAVLLLGAAIGCLSVGVLNLNNMRDMQNDEASGKRTIPVMIGLEKARFYHYFLCITPMLFFTLYALLRLPMLSLALLVPPYFLLIRHLMEVRMTNGHAAFNPLLPKLAISTFLLSLCFALAVALAIHMK